jgi:alpha-L-rhamnosidase
MHLATGFVGTPYLNHVLTAGGRLEVAYALLLQRSYPSWLFPIAHGATTIWERWDGWTPERGFQDPAMNSFNHYAYGAIGDWLYSLVAGIDIDPAQPGYKHIVLHPRPGGTLTFARATYESLYGRIESEWQREGDGFEWRVVIPPNTTATVFVPANADAEITLDGQSVPVARSRDNIILHLGAGEYQIAARLNR